MKFDYTYITLFGYTVFEPMVVLTNGLFFILSVIFAWKLFRFNSHYPKQMGWFLLSLGGSMLFGAIGHSVQMQAGELFFSIVLFLMNACSLASAFFCFRSSYYLITGIEKKKVLIAAEIIGALMLLISLLTGDFAVIKVVAGLVLLFALYAHQLDWKRNGRVGSRMVNVGIGIAFLSIITHTLHISLHKWFNHKDISHVIMIVSLVVIYNGARTNPKDNSVLAN